MASSSNWEEQGIKFKIITKEQVFLLYTEQNFIVPFLCCYYYYTTVLLYCIGIGIRVLLYNCYTWTEEKNHTEYFSYTLIQWFFYRCHEIFLFQVVFINHLPPSP
jgi:hypothetical protein